MSEEKIKLISLNVEGNRHLERVTPFLMEENPDVLCLQEVYEYDVSKFLKKDENYFFVPLTRKAYPPAGERKEKGIAIVTALPVISHSVSQYTGDRLRDFDSNDQTSWNKALLVVTVSHSESAFTIGTTHFTWTPNGEVNEAQRKDLPSLLSSLKKFPEIVLCGDFNAPRGKEIFSKLALQYKDNIPLHYDSSLDPTFHRAAPLNLMVDGLFTTPEYKASDVKLISGVSDHQAVVSYLEKN